MPKRATQSMKQKMGRKRQRLDLAANIPTRDVNETEEEEEMDEEFLDHGGEGDDFVEVEEGEDGEDGEGSEEEGDEGDGYDVDSADRVNFDNLDHLERRLMSGTYECDAADHCKYILLQSVVQFYLATFVKVLKVFSVQPPISKRAPTMVKIHTKEGRHDKLMEVDQRNGVPGPFISSLVATTRLMDSFSTEARKKVIRKLRKACATMLAERDFSFGKVYKYINLMEPKKHLFIVRNSFYMPKCLFIEAKVETFIDLVQSQGFDIPMRTGFSMRKNMPQFERVASEALIRERLDKQNLLSVLERAQEKRRSVEQRLKKEMILLRQLSGVSGALNVVAFQPSFDRQLLPGVEQLCLTAAQRVLDDTTQNMPADWNEVHGCVLAAASLLRKSGTNFTVCQCSCLHNRCTKCFYDDPCERRMPPTVDVTNELSSAAEVNLPPQQPPPTRRDVATSPLRDVEVEVEALTNTVGGLVGVEQTDQIFVVLRDEHASDDTEAHVLLDLLPVVTSSPVDKGTEDPPHHVEVNEDRMVDVHGDQRPHDQVTDVPPPHDVEESGQSRLEDGIPDLPDANHATSKNTVADETDDNVAISVVRDALLKQRENAPEPPSKSRRGRGKKPRKLDILRALRVEDRSVRRHTERLRRLMSQNRGLTLSRAIRHGTYGVTDMCILCFHPEFVRKFLLGAVQDHSLIRPQVLKLNSEFNVHESFHDYLYCRYPVPGPSNSIHEAKNGEEEAEAGLGGQHPDAGCK